MLFSSSNRYGFASSRHISIKRVDFVLKARGSVEWEGCGWFARNRGAPDRTANFHLIHLTLLMFAPPLCSIATGSGNHDAMYWAQLANLSTIYLNIQLLGWWGDICICLVLVRFVWRVFPTDTIREATRGKEGLLTTFSVRILMRQHEGGFAPRQTTNYVFNHRLDQLYIECVSRIYEIVWSLGKMILLAILMLLLCVLCVRARLNKQTWRACLRLNSNTSSILLK